MIGWNDQWMKLVEREIEGERSLDQFLSSIALIIISRSPVS